MLQFINKTGLQPVSRPVARFIILESAKSLWSKGFADGQPYRMSGGSRCIKLGTKVCKIQQTDIQIDR